MKKLLKCIKLSCITAILTIAIVTYWSSTEYVFNVTVTNQNTTGLLWRQLHSNKLRYHRQRTAPTQNNGEHIAPTQNRTEDNKAFFKMNPQELCDSEIYLMIIVCSAIPNTEARQAIRNTWGNKTMLKQRFKSRLLFIMGNPDKTKEDFVNLTRIIQFESNRYSDIILADFIDKYDNLPKKSTSLIQWVNTFCHNAKYILKIDDDVYLNIPNLNQSIQQLGARKNFIMGGFVTKAAPFRDKKNRYFISEQEYSGKVYPDYISGAAYLMSHDTINKLYKCIQETSQFRMEDIYITGLCRVRSKIYIVQHKGFIKFQNLGPQPCTYDSITVCHGFTVKMVYDVWEASDKITWKCRKNDSLSTTLAS